MKTFIYTVMSVLLICAIVYGMYWVFKSFSYFLFYEDMVQDTIRELVKQGALK